MKKLFTLLFFVPVLVFAAGTKKQIEETFANFGTNPQPVYSVSSGKKLDLKTIILSTFNTSTSAGSIQLRDSGSIIHTFYLSEKEANGFGKSATHVIDFDEAWTATQNLNLRLASGTSGSVSASISVLGFER